MAHQLWQAFDVEPATGLNIVLNNDRANYALAGGPDRLTDRLVRVLGEGDLSNQRPNARAARRQSTVDHDPEDPGEMWEQHRRAGGHSPAAAPSYPYGTVSPVCGVDWTGLLAVGLGVAILPRLV